MNNWWSLAILSGAGLASRNVLLKLANVKIDPAMAAMVLSVSMAITSIAFMLFSRFYQARLENAVENPVNWNLAGILPAALAGIGLAAANILLVFSYKAGGSAALVGVLQTLCAIGITMLVGVFLLNETIRPMQFAGAIVALAGIFLIIKG